MAGSPPTANKPVNRMPKTAHFWFPPLRSAARYIQNQAYPMKLIAQIVLVACIHVAFLFSAYGTQFFSLSLPPVLLMVIWLGVSSVLAFAAYFFALLKTKLLALALYREAFWIFCAGLATLTSLYTGVFLALNTYGE